MAAYQSWTKVLKNTPVERGPETKKGANRLEAVPLEANWETEVGLEDWKGQNSSVSEGEGTNL